MNTIDDLINKAGEFECFFNDGTSLKCSGNLIWEDNLYKAYLTCERQFLKKIDSLRGKYITVTGNIFGSEVILHEAFVCKTLSGEGVTCAWFVPNVIVVGCSSATRLQVTRIEAKVMALNYMFSDIPVEYLSPSKENPALLSLNNIESLDVTDDQKELSFVYELGVHYGQDKFVANYNPWIICNFQNQVSLNNAIKQLTSARNLFSFFGDRCILFDAIQVEISKDKKLIRCQVVQNYRESAETNSHSFLIKSNDLKSHFQEIWKRWNDFNLKSPDIVNLFYEVIQDKTYGINIFLNLMQVLEIYSQKYRNDKAEEIHKKFEPKDKKIKLWQRLYDLLEFKINLFNIAGISIEEIAKNISDARNYYTHYNEKRFNRPSYNFIVYSNIFLRALLLSLVYEHLGISESIVKENLFHYTYSSVFDAIEYLVTEKIKKQYVNIK